MKIVVKDKKSGDKIKLEDFTLVFIVMEFIIVFCAFGLYGILFGRIETQANSLIIFIGGSVITTLFMFTILFIDAKIVITRNDNMKFKDKEFNDFGNEKTFSFGDDENIKQYAIDDIDLMKD